MSALSSAQQSEVKAWEEEILACEHTLTLQQEPVITIGQGKRVQQLEGDYLRKIDMTQSLPNAPLATLRPTSGSVSPAVWRIAGGSNSEVSVGTVMRWHTSTRPHMPLG